MFSGVLTSATGAAWSSWSWGFYPVKFDLTVLVTFLTAVAKDLKRQLQGLFWHTVQGCNPSWWERQKV